MGLAGNLLSAAGGKAQAGSNDEITLVQIEDPPVVGFPRPPESGRPGWERDSESSPARAAGVRRAAPRRPEVRATLDTARAPSPFPGRAGSSGPETRRTTNRPAPHARAATEGAR